MRHENIVVTGGSGFLGSHLARKLVTSGHKVTVFDITPLSKSRNLDPTKDHERFTFIHGDIRDKHLLGQVLNKDVDRVFHLSSIVGVKNYIANPLLVIESNVVGTLNVLELAHRNNIKVMFSSTSEVYGKNSDIPWSEDADRVLGSTSIERWSYSTSKAVCEHMILGMHKNLGLQATIVRYFNLYGPGQAPHFVISQSIYRVLRNEQPLLYDKGKQTRCFTFIEDAVAGTIAAAFNPKANGEVFNIGNNRETAIREALEIIIRTSCKNISWIDFDTREHYGDKYEDITRRIPDVNKAKRLLGWEAETTLEQGIRKTIQWARENPWWLE
jgi:UDP-glucose 4-epimerase